MTDPVTALIDDLKIRDEQAQKELERQRHNAWVETMRTSAVEIMDYITQAFSLELRQALKAYPGCAINLRQSRFQPAAIFDYQHRHYWLYTREGWNQSTTWHIGNEGFADFPVYLSDEKNLSQDDFLRALAGAAEQSNRLAASGSDFTYQFKNFLEDEL